MIFTFFDDFYVFRRYLCFSMISTFFDDISINGPCIDPRAHTWAHGAFWGPRGPIRRAHIWTPGALTWATLGPMGPYMGPMAQIWALGAHAPSRKRDGRFRPVVGLSRK